MAIVTENNERVKMQASNPLTFSARRESGKIEQTDANSSRPLMSKDLLREMEDFEADDLLEQSV